MSALLTEPALVALLEVPLSKGWHPIAGRPSICANSLVQGRKCKVPFTASDEVVQHSGELVLKRTCQGQSWMSTCNVLKVSSKAHLPAQRA